MSCPRQSTSQGESKSVGFKDVKQEPQHQRPSYGHFGRNNSSARFEQSLLFSRSEKQTKALIKVRALSRGNSTRRNVLDSSISSITDEGSPNEESQRWNSEDLPTTESFYEDYVDQLKAELAAKSEDNKKLRASLSKQTAPTTPHDRSEKDGSRLSRFFKHFGRASAANDLARTSTFHPGRSTGGPNLLKRGLLGGGAKSAKVAPTPYAV